MNENQKRVGKARFEGIDNAWILVNGVLKKQDEPDRMVKPYMSFLYHEEGSGIAIEWEPEYGPIQVWYECDGDCQIAKEHYFFDFVERRLGGWALGAVYQDHLPEAFARGDYRHIFAVLQGWATEAGR